MLLFDEQNQQVDLQELKAEVLKDTGLESADAQDEQGLEADLAQMYSTALDSQLAEFELSEENKQEGIRIFPGLGKKILQKVRSLICPKLTPDASQDSIVDAILDALASILPGGKIIKFIVKKLVKFILGKGVSAFCPAA